MLGIALIHFSSLTIPLFPLFVFQLTLRCFHFSGVINKAATNISMHVPLCARVPQGYKNEIAGLQTVFINDSANPFAKVIVLIYISFKTFK